MTTDDTLRGTGGKLRMQARLSALTIAVGVALMIFMIATESEPGALPLLLIVVGTGWRLVTRARIRSRRR